MINVALAVLGGICMLVGGLAGAVAMDIREAPRLRIIGAVACVVLTAGSIVLLSAVHGGK